MFGKESVPTPLVLKKPVALSTGNINIDSVEHKTIIQLAKYSKLKVVICRLQQQQ